MTLTCNVAFQKISHTGCSVNPSDTLVIAVEWRGRFKQGKEGKAKKGGQYSLNASH